MCQLDQFRFIQASCLDPDETGEGVRSGEQRRTTFGTELPGDSVAAVCRLRVSLYIPRDDIQGVHIDFYAYVKGIPIGFSAVISKKFRQH